MPFSIYGLKEGAIELLCINSYMFHKNGCAHLGKKSNHRLGKAYMHEIVMVIRKKNGKRKRNKKGERGKVFFSQSAIRITMFFTSEEGGWNFRGDPSNSYYYSFS